MPDFDELDDLQGNTDGDTESDDSAGEATSPPSGDKSEKRIRDLQAKADAAEAKANKLQKMLDAAMQGAGAEDSKPKPGGRQMAPGESLAIEFMKESVFQTTPKMAEAGFTAADLSGSTPSEIRASAAELVRRYEENETRIRNKVLAEHGLAPEIVNNTPAPKVKNYFDLPKKDFDELLEKALQGRV